MAHSVIEKAERIRIELIQKIKKDLQNKMVYIKAAFPDNADPRNLEDYINDIDAWEV